MDPSFLFDLKISKCIIHFVLLSCRASLYLGSLAVAPKSDFHWLDLIIAFVFITMNCFVL